MYMLVLQPFGTEKEKEMQEIKEGSKVRSLFRTGTMVGLEGVVLETKRANSHTVMVFIDPDDSEKFPDSPVVMLDYQLECLDPEEEELDVPAPLWVPLAHKDVFDHRSLVRVLTLDGHLIVEGRRGSASMVGDSLTYVEVKCRWSKTYHSFDTDGLTEVRFERKVATGA